MSLFAIGDLHLHYQSVLKAKDQLNSPLWADHEERFAENCRRLIEEEDTLVLVGDHSWGRNLEECEKDFEYIKSLPGRKILTRGNHDMFWDAKKTAKLNDLYYPDLTFLQDGYAVYKDFALVASKGYTFEGPFYLDRKGKIIGYDESDFEHAKKLVERRMAIRSSSCSCIIRRQASLKRIRSLQILLQDTMCRRSSTPIVMEKAGFMIPLKGSTAAGNTVLSREII